IRSCPVFSATSSFGSVVIIANVSIACFLSGERQCRHTPPSANGASSFIPKSHGSLVFAFIRFHSTNESTGTRQRLRKNASRQILLSRSVSPFALIVSSRNFFGSLTKRGRNRQNIICRVRVPHSSSHTITGCIVCGATL